jgi:hypothetical protein
MAIAISVTNVDATGVTTWMTGTLVFSGNYVTGGDTLDWTGAMEAVGASGQVVASGSGPQQVMIDSQNGNAGYYVPVQGSGINNWKVKCFTGGGTEVSAGAYPGSITADAVAFQAQFKRLQ